MSIQDTGSPLASTRQLGWGIKGKAHLEILVVRKFIEGNLVIKKSLSITYTSGDDSVITVT